MKSIVLLLEVRKVLCLWAADLECKIHMHHGEKMSVRILMCVCFALVKLESLTILMGILDLLLGLISTLLLEEYVMTF